MSKRRHVRRRRSRSAQKARGHRQQSANLKRYLSQAGNLIEGDRALEAVDLLEPLLDSYPRVAELHFYLGFAHVQAGDLWRGLEEYERAMSLSHNPSYWHPLAVVYLELGMVAHALHAFRQALKYGVDAGAADEVRQAISWLEHDIVMIAQTLMLPMTQVEKGLRYMEEANHALQNDNFQVSIAADRRAIKLMGDWPPPRNNLSLALFYNGQPQKAIAAARQVLVEHPENVQAMSNAIRFLAWSGREAEARKLWIRLKEFALEEDDTRLKAAEAGAVMHDDEGVFELLMPVAKAEGIRPDVPGLGRRAMLFLAIAEANLAKPTARRRIRALLSGMPWLKDLLTALKDGRPGPGWADRFPYFRSMDLMARSRMEEFVELLSREKRMSPQRFEKAATRFAERFPQIVLVAEKLIWEEMQPEAGMAILNALRTPAAHAALRRFGLSQAGSDDARMRALSMLSEAGEISPDETLRVWLEGEWTESKMRRHDISSDPQSVYAPQIEDLLRQGLMALEDGELERAERLFQRVLELEPQAKEAHNSLATIYARRGEHQRAKQMLQAALDIDPLYVLPRCNLALYLLDEGDVDEAAGLLKPVDEVSRFQPREMAYQSYTQARILIEQDQYEAARDALEAALAVWPGYTLAEDLLQRLDMIVRTQTAFRSFTERQRRRDRAKRNALQAKIATPDPSLAQALPVYTKEALVGTGRVVLPEGGWSALRKGELIQLLIEWLADPDNVERIAADLGEEERNALKQVCAHGGHMPWQEFDARYGNDLEESRHWQWFRPETTMGRLRLRGLLVEATVDGELLVAVPVELRSTLAKVLG